MARLKTSLEYVIGMVLREWKMTRRQFDLGVPDEDQEDMIAHYLAGLCLQRWQNWRDWMRLKSGGK